MFMLTFTMFMLMINTLFIMMSHPLAITLLIIIQTMMICITTGSISYSFWFSYILFLIFLGGMLVLFIYITSLASNEMFQLPVKTMIINFMMSITIILTMSYMFNHMLSFHMYMNDSFTNKIINITMENNNLNQLYNYPNFIMTIITIMYLLITLIIIVKITSFQEGPLRHSSS
nr:NADH dehydrogenase subunit 6 [Gryllus bimaculatus]